MLVVAAKRIGIVKVGHSPTIAWGQGSGKQSLRPEQVQDLPGETLSGRKG